MPSDVTRDEFQHLATRTDIVEREVEGEKLVTRHILEQTRRNGDDLATIKTRLEGVDLKGLVRKVDGLDRKVDGLSREFGDLRAEFVGLRGQFAGLRESLPDIVGDAVREAIEPLTRRR